MTQQLPSELEDELAQVSERYWAEFRLRSQVWRLPLLPVRFNAPRVGFLYLGFHLVLLFTGAVLILTRGALHDLGLALVVGALFALGSAGAQVWGVAYQREQALFERTLGPGYFDATLMHLGRKMQEISASLDQTHPANPEQQHGKQRHPVD